MISNDLQIKGYNFCDLIFFPWVDQSFLFLSKALCCYQSPALFCVFFLALQTFSIHLLGRCNLQTYLWSLISPYWMWLVNSCSGISVSLNTDALVLINCLPLSRVFLSASCVLVNGKLGTRLTLFVFLISSYYLGQGWNTFTCASDQCSVHYIISCSS